MRTARRFALGVSLLAAITAVGAAPALADSNPTPGQNATLTVTVPVSLTFTFTTPTAIDFGNVPAGGQSTAGTISYTVDSNATTGYHVDITPTGNPINVDFYIGHDGVAPTTLLTAGTPLNAWNSKPSGGGPTTWTDDFKVMVAASVPAGTYVKTLTYVAALGATHS